MARIKSIALARVVRQHIALSRRWARRNRCAAAVDTYAEQKYDNGLALVSAKKGRSEKLAVAAP
jgi:hypothetical protein